ncbi:MAG TPA: hypothetical protein VK118_00190 [Tetragenococcus sp.]|nr:hypothetical protein [Tetragenococcus sp.]
MNHDGKGKVESLKIKLQNIVAVLTIINLLLVIADKIKSYKD